MLKTILKGVVIGIANIIPGVSGGTMAVSMGIYDKLIYAITHILKEFKESMKIIIPIAIGAGLALAGLSKVITISLDKFPVPTNFLFIGLIVGGMPVILKRLKGTGKKVSIGNVIALVAFFALVVGFASLGEGKATGTEIAFTFVNVMKMFVVGIIASATMVIPGVSGSMVLMLLGYYESVLSNISLFIDSLIAFDMQGILAACGVLVPFGIGVLLGIAIIAKMIEVVFNKLPNYAYCAIIGLILASPIAIIMMSDFSRYSIGSVLAGVVTFVLGYLTAMKLGEE